MIDQKSHRWKQGILDIQVAASAWRKCHRTLKEHRNSYVKLPASKHNTKFLQNAPALL